MPRNPQSSILQQINKYSNGLQQIHPQSWHQTDQSQNPNIILGPPSPSAGNQSQRIGGSKQQTAPANSIPAIPMFITAPLSHIIPAIAAKAIGTALTTVACSIPVRENDLPAVAQTKKAAIAKKKLKAIKIVKFLGA